MASIPRMMLIDGHVHLHDDVDPASLLAAGLANLRVAAAGLGVGPRYSGVLCLTDPEGFGGFQRARELADSGQAGWGEGQWSPMPTGIAAAVGWCSPEGSELFVVAGRQIRTRERLEVLGLGTTEDLSDGLPTDETIVAVAQSGAVPVIPWGFGKWMGRRGRLLEALLARADLPRFLLGDNANRPRGTGTPPLLRAARERGLATLPGTDPLPLAGEHERVGSYGCFFPLETGDPVRPVAELLALAEEEGGQRTFGSRIGLARFLRTQTALCLRRGFR